MTSAGLVCDLGATSHSLFSHPAQPFLQVSELVVTAEITTLQLRYHNLHWAGRGRTADDPRVVDEAPGAPLSAPPSTPRYAIAVAVAAEAASATDGNCEEQLSDAMVDRALLTAHAALLAAGHPPPVGALTLPALVNPLPDSAPSPEAVFALHNASRTPLRLELRPQPLAAAAVAAVGDSGSDSATGTLSLDLELLSKHSGSPLSSLLTLAAGERLDIIVRAFGVHIPSPVHTRCSCLSSHAHPRRCR